MTEYLDRKSQEEKRNAWIEHSEMKDRIPGEITQ
jgi:hypothetical protein